ncbi:MAG TPA: putative colanic acid biosynthesis acetyltransferase [Acidobacteriaceae bacterium]|nr:putative colanic acid biosynthesis acetyltransferase [Acidobacteriaceae bacterium]
MSEMPDDSAPLSSMRATSQPRDPYISPQYTFANRVRRQLWSFCWILLYRPSPRVAHVWRAALLRLFGATLGPRCRFYPASRVWAPWNLTCEDTVMVADGAELYNPAPLYLASHAIVSQGAYLCGATHDYDNPAFPVISFSTRLGRYAWVAARACVSPGVNLGDGAILGLASLATKDLEPWSIYAGVPARKVKDRLPIAMG